MFDFNGIPEPPMWTIYLFLCIIGVLLLPIIYFTWKYRHVKLDEQYIVCHRCGEIYHHMNIQYFRLSSDSRAHATPLCKNCQCALDLDNKSIWKHRFDGFNKPS